MKDQIEVEALRASLCRKMSCGHCSCSLQDVQTGDTCGQCHDNERIASLTADRDALRARIALASAPVDPPKVFECEGCGVPRALELLNGDGECATCAPVDPSPETSVAGGREAAMSPIRDARVYVCNKCGYVGGGSTAEHPPCPYTAALIPQPEPPTGESKLREIAWELLRLYDWRFEIGEMEIAVSDFTFGPEEERQAERKRIAVLLQTYGLQKKTAWQRLREEEERKS